MQVVGVRGRHFNSGQPSGLNFDCGMSLLLSGGVGAYERDKNTSAKLCTKNAGGLMHEVEHICGTLQYYHKPERCP